MLHCWQAFVASSLGRRNHPTSLGHSRSDWMLPGGSVFVKPLDRKAPGRSATQTLKDVEALNEFARSEPPYRN